MVTILFVAAAAIVAAAFLINWHLRQPPKVPSPNSPFTFSKDRLWASVDGRQELALIDSGTSMSIFPANWYPISLSDRIETGVSQFGQRQFATGAIGPIKIAGVTFKGNVMVADMDYPIIGDDFIFSSNNVLFSISGLRFDVPYDPADAVHCARMVFAYEAEPKKSAVNAVYFLLKIDDREQMVFFDTGNPAALEGTAFAPMPEKKLFPIPDLISNSMGQWRFTQFFYRHAQLSLGAEKMTLSYQHFYTQGSVDAPFIMGAGILNHFSILLDGAHDRACFFKAPKS